MIRQAVSQLVCFMLIERQKFACREGLLRCIGCGKSAKIVCGCLFKLSVFWVIVRVAALAKVEHLLWAHAKNNFGLRLKWITGKLPVVNGSYGSLPDCRWENAQNSGQWLFQADTGPSRNSTGYPLSILLESVIHHFWWPLSSH